MEPDKEMEGRRVIEAHLTRSIIFAKDMVKMTRFYRDVLGLVPQPGEEPPEEWLPSTRDRLSLLFTSFPKERPRKFRSRALRPHAGARPRS